MPTYSKGNKYITKVTTPAGRITRMTDTREAGEAWELAVRAAVKLGKPIPEPEGKAPSLGGKDAGTMAGVLRNAEALHWNKLRASHRTVGNATLFVDWAGPKSDPREVFTKGRIQDFVRYLSEERKVSNTTMNRYMSCVSVLMKHADVKPIELPWFKGHKGRVRFFSPEEERAVNAYLAQREKHNYVDLFIFLNDTGLRPWEEACKVTWKQVRNGMVRDVYGKNGEYRDVPLTRRAMTVLERRPRDQAGPFSDIVYYSAKDMWDQVREHMPKLRDTVWYTCRHTFASRLIQGGKTITQVARLMGNTAAIVDSTYSHLAPDHLKDAVEALEQYGTQETRLTLVQNAPTE